MSSMIDYKTLPLEELQSIAYHANHELHRRATIEDAQRQAEAIQVRYANAIGRKDGDAWVQPTGAHDAYKQYFVCSHGGGSWESLVPNNVWEPGVSGWREIVTDDGGEPLPVDDQWPHWVQPIGSHDAYKQGDRVTFEADRYISLIDENVWSPIQHPAGWDKQ
ncbi:MAG: hypothetical protein Q4G71_09980 [Pseudomonadota bacterium]|nr:hypothetical protein [Pseudomonadota bacterium]